MDRLDLLYVDLAVNGDDLQVLWQLTGPIEPPGVVPTDGAMADIELTGDIVQVFIDAGDFNYTLAVRPGNQDLISIGRSFGDGPYESPPAVGAEATWTPTSVTLTLPLDTLPGLPATFTWQATATGFEPWAKLPSGDPMIVDGDPVGGMIFEDRCASDDDPALFPASAATTEQAAGTASASDQTTTAPPLSTPATSAAPPTSAQLPSSAQPAPWGSGPETHPVAAQLTGITSKPSFAGCPLLWPVDGPAVELLGGEGLEDWTANELYLTDAGVSATYTWAASIDALAGAFPDLIEHLPQTPEVEYTDGSTVTRVGLGPAWYAVLRPAGADCAWVLTTPPEADPFHDELLQGIRSITPAG